VEGAAEGPVVEVTGSVGKARAAVQAHVVERVDRAVRVARDDRGLVADVVHEIVARRRELLFAAGDLPDARPQVVELEGEELGVEVARLRHEPVVVRQPRGPVGGRSGHRCGM
jgi:hypothetical protein